MKCIYCKKGYPLADWGQHSQECKDRKRIRGGVVVPEQKPDTAEVTPPSAVDFLNMDIEDMSKDLLIDYLNLEGIEHDPKAKKYQLKKLAKGE